MKLWRKLSAALVLIMALIAVTGYFVVIAKGIGQLGGVVSFFGALVLLYPSIRQTLESRLFTNALEAPSDQEFEEIDSEIRESQHRSHVRFAPADYFALITGMSLVCIGFALTVLLSPSVIAKST